MDELGFNKIAAAVLATGLAFMGLKELSHAVMHVSAPEVPVYKLADIAAQGAGEAEIELPFPQETWVAAMDAERGAKVFKKCTSCHNAENGGANGTGPNLWNVVGAKAAVHDGFKYSAAMVNSGFEWNYETLNNYLEKPTRYLSGTAMNFVGLKKDTDRAAVIEYLRVAADTPIARPAPAIVEAPAEDAASLEAVVEGAAQDAGSLLETVVDAATEGASDAVDAVEKAADKAVDAVQDVTGTDSEPTDSEKAEEKTDSPE